MLVVATVLYLPPPSLMLVLHNRSSLMQLRILTCTSSNAKPAVQNTRRLSLGTTNNATVLKDSPTISIQDLDSIAFVQTSTPSTQPLLTVFLFTLAVLQTQLRALMADASVLLDFINLNSKAKDLLAFPAPYAIFKARISLQLWSITSVFATLA